jgi:chemosensory pili system protein ChpA (sensor histidine kinase/response regulator)
MDAVRTAVGRLKGSIELASEPGRGVTFRIRLPLTLAVVRALMVRASGERFAVPMASITQVMRVDAERIERMGRQAVLRAEGQVLPAVHLGEALKLKNPADTSVRNVPVLVLEVGGRRLALVVDHLLEAREVVVKKLGGLVGGVRGVLGATVMGDGGVVLIIDPNGLVEAGSVGAGQRPRAVAAAPGGFDVLIVDDSMSVRRVLANTVRKAGHRAVTARDGLEALELLEQGAPPDVVLLDIEMPRMDGYELTAALRARPALKGVPVVMLTSRAGEKHRRKAFDLGATDYLVKPYAEEALLEVVRRVVGEARARAGEEVRGRLG